ncbi:histidine ABC transporter ATP-binding protein [Burkholderia contaminans]|nr:histidine ABC transporter ATP-binding protein [Burkholderia contaminans]
MAEITQTSAAASTKLAAVDIHKRYGDNEVLKGVSLNAKAGDVISIIGASGSGKRAMSHRQLKVGTAGAA